MKCKRIEGIELMNVNRGDRLPRIGLGVNIAGRDVSVQICRSDKVNINHPFSGV